MCAQHYFDPERKQNEHSTRRHRPRQERKSDRPLGRSRNFREDPSQPAGPQVHGYLEDDRHAGADRRRGGRSHPGAARFLPANGTKIRIAEIPPEPESFRTLTPAQVQEFFKSGGNESASTFHEDGRHPFMHRTESVDYAVVLEGEITMLLDDEDIVLKAGDIVIQRGTNHAWSNRSGKPVRMLYILIDGKFDPTLEASSARGRPRTEFAYESLPVKGC